MPHERRIEVEARRLPGHVRVDPGGIIDHTVKPPRKGGILSLRYGRARAIEFTIWIELVHDIFQALNAAFWRRETRRTSE